MINQVFKEAINIAAAHEPYANLLNIITEGFAEMQESFETLQYKCGVAKNEHLTLTHTADPSQTNGKITLHKSNEPYIDVNYSYSPKDKDFYIRASNIRYNNNEYLDHDRSTVNRPDVNEAADRIASMVADLAKRFGHPGIKGTLDAALKAKRSVDIEMEPK